MPNASGKNVTDGLIFWEEGIGDTKTFHIAHLSPTRLTMVRKMKDHARWQEAVSAANRSLDQAQAVLQQLPQAIHFASEELSKATYSEDLNQLTLFGRNQQTTKIPRGKGQKKVFAAIKSHLGGTEIEEEADAWSVVQTPLFILAVFGTLGGLMIYITTIADPNYQATGRRAGLKMLLDRVFYAIGPFWMSLAVCLFSAFALGIMIFQLIKRPIRQVLKFSDPTPVRRP